MLNRNLQALSILLIAASCGTVEPIDADTDGGNPAVAPVIASVTPANGPLEGGNDITLSGENFTVGLTVVMNGREVVDALVPDGNTITFQAPSATTAGELADILVYGDTGFGRIEAAYTYNAGPTIALVAPAFGPLSGGAPIEIRGSGFLENNAGTPTVRIGDLEATNVQVVDDTTLTATSPSAAPDIVALPQDVVVENDNGTAATDDSFVFVRPGLLLATRKNEFGTPLGISFFDIPTKRLVQLAALDSGVARMEFVPGNGLIMRLNRIGAIGGNGPRMWRRVDLQTGSISDLGPVRVGQNAQTMRPVAFVGGQLRGLNSSRQFGSIDLNAMTFNGVGPTAGNPFRGCLAANGANSVFHLDGANEELSTFIASTGIVTAGPPISGLPAGGDLRCHGATNAAGTLFAVFIDRSFSEQPASLYRINTATGVATLEADLGNGYGALTATPTGF